MTEPTETPVQTNAANIPASTSVQPANQTDWEGRYKGASQKINELMSQIADLQAQLSSRASEMEQLKTNLGVKDVEKDTAINGYKTQLEAALAEKSAMTGELTALKALKAKMDVAKKLNAPQLFPILDSIPYVENPEALETIAKTFVDWGESQAKQREAQLTAGITPSSPSTPMAPSLPTNSKDWEDYVNSKPFGPEREKAYEDWFKWGSSQSK